MHVKFDSPFYGIVYSQNYYQVPQCTYVTSENSQGRTSFRWVFLFLFFVIPFWPTISVDPLSWAGGKQPGTSNRTSRRISEKQRDVGCASASMCTYTQITREEKNKISLITVFLYTVNIETLKKRVPYQMSACSTRLEGNRTGRSRRSFISKPIHRYIRFV